MRDASFLGLRRSLDLTLPRITQHWYVPISGKDSGKTRDPRWSDWLVPPSHIPQRLAQSNGLPFLDVAGHFRMR